MRDLTPSYVPETGEVILDGPPAGLPARPGSFLSQAWSWPSTAPMAIWSGRSWTLPPHLPWNWSQSCLAGMPQELCVTLRGKPTVRDRRPCRQQPG